MMFAYLKSLKTVFLLFLSVSNTFPVYTNFKDDVQNLPFLNLYRVPKSLHLIEDLYRLVQHIDVRPLAEQIHSISTAFTEINDKFKLLNVSQLYDNQDLETKIIFLIEQAAETLHAGMTFLPHAEQCYNRQKREVEIPNSTRLKRFAGLDLDVDVVNTNALFPQVGTLFSYITGSLDASAGKVINLNYHNVEKLVAADKNFAQMFNASLSIERKHAQQLINLHSEVDNLKIKFKEETGTFSKRLAY